MEISVRIDNQTDIFFCDDEQCSKVTEAATTYAMYSDEEARLPLEKED